VIKGWNWELAGIIVTIGGDQVAGIGIDAEEVGGAAYAMNLLSGELRQSGSCSEALLFAQVPNALDHHLGIVTVLGKDGMTEPAYIELHGSLGGLTILGGVGIPGLWPRRIQCDAHASTLTRLEELPVHVHHLGVSLQQIVTTEVGGNAWIVVRRCHIIHSVTVLTHMPRLIDGGPDLHPISVHFQHQASIVLEKRNYLRIGPATQLLQLLRQFPVIDRHHRSDVVPQQFVDQVGIVLNAGCTDVVHIATGHNSWPGQGEAIGAHMQLLDHLHIALPLEKFQLTY